MEIFTIIGKEYDSNIFVILGDIPTIIDTGTGFHSKWVIETISKFIDPKKIKQIILTHEHYDHVGGSLDILKSSDSKAKIFSHKNLVEKLENGKSNFASKLGGTMPKLKIDKALVGNENLKIGDELFDVIYTPGHSKGSICLYDSKNKSLFSGDTIFAYGDFGRYDLEGGDFNELLNSIKYLSSIDVKSLYPGHGPVIEEFATDHIQKSLRNAQTLA